MRGRTDLAAEQAEKFAERLPKGICQQTQCIEGVTVHCVRVESPDAARLLGKPCGNYYTIEGQEFAHTPKDIQQQAAAAAKVLTRLLPARGPVLVVGLGNRSLTPDSLGPLVADRIIATRHMAKELRRPGGLRQTAVLAPGVLPQTGFEVAEQTAWAVEKLRPSAVVAVDALAAAGVERLGRTIQISDVGIVPGSGVMGKHLPLSRDTLGVKVIAVGVPMVIDAATFVEEYLRRVGVAEEVIAGRRSVPLMVACHDADVAVARCVRCLSLALNKALQPHLDWNEIAALTQ